MNNRAKERKRINSKLIELVKPHEILYNRKKIWNNYTINSLYLWHEIADSMNKIFNLNRGKH